MKLRLIKYHQYPITETSNRIELVAKKGLPAPAVQPLGTVKLAKCALLLNLSDKELAIEYRASLADWTNRHIIGGFAMSITSKLSPKSLAIKEKLHCRLGLTNKRCLPLAQKPVENSDQNAEWSLPTAALSTSDLGQDVRNNVFFIKTEKSNQNVLNLEKRHNSTSPQGDLFQSQENKSHRINSAVLQYLHVAQGYSSMRMTEYYVAISESARSSSISTVSKHIESLKKFHAYLRGLPPSKAIEEDNL